MVVNPIMRQNRAGSSHHFPLSQFSTSSLGGAKNQGGGEIQVAIPLTTLIFSQTASLPPGHHMMSTLQQQQSMGAFQISQLEGHSWFPGRIPRNHAETMLATRPIGSFLVRQSESGNSNDCSLSLM